MGISEKLSARKATKDLVLAVRAYREQAGA